MDNTTPAPPSSDSTQSEFAAVRFRPLRVWPAVVLLLGMVIARLIPSLVQNGPTNIWMSAAFGPIACGVLIALWWLTVSRASWRERIAGIVGLLGSAAVTMALVDKTMHGPAMMVLTIPMGTAAFAIGASLFGRMLSFRRTVIAIVMAACGFGPSTLLKSDGLWGNFSLELRWRWQTTNEDRVLARPDLPSEVLKDFDPAEVDAWLAQTRVAHLPGRRSDWQAAWSEGVVRLVLQPA